MSEQQQVSKDPKGATGTAGVDPIGVAVREVIARHLTSAQRAGAAALGDEVILAGKEGLAFDSVRLVELCLACEERFRVKIPPTLLERGPLSVGGLAAEVRRLCAAKPS